MSEQYLILHKVRGEPSFDCAEKMEVDGEEWWITNSGYRAYPYKHWPLDYFMQTDPSVPADWPDHFPNQGEKPAPSFNIMDAIHKMIPKITRRI